MSRGRITQAQIARISVVCLHRTDTHVGPVCPVLSGSCMVERCASAECTGYGGPVRTVKR